MPGTTAAKTTTPRRTRPAPAKSTAAKAAPVKAAPKETPAETGAANSAVDRVTIELDYDRDTKNYAMFKVPDAYKGTMAGGIYAPLGTDKVKVAIFGVDATDFDIE